MSFSPSEYGEVLLNGVPFPVAGQISTRNLARFENRVVIGDPTKDDDELLSSRVYSDFSGGMMIYNEREGADNGRYWFAEGVHTRSPGQLALGPLVVRKYITTSGQWTSVRFLGEFGSYVYFWADDSTGGGTGSRVFRWSESGGFVNVAPWPGPPTVYTPYRPGTVYNGKLYVPCTNGYVTFNGSAWEASEWFAARDFCQWDAKLVAIDDTGQIQFLNPGTTTWETPTDGKLDANVIPYRLQVYFTQSGENAIYVITSDGVFAWDESLKYWIKTTVVWPHYPAAGLDAAVWRSGEAMHIASGLGMLSWTGPGGTVASNGLDRDEQLPSEYMNQVITRLCPTNNALYAMVARSMALTNVNANRKRGVFAYDGAGWTALWTSSDTTYESITEGFGTIGTTTSTGVYRLWWTDGAAIYTVKLAHSATNSRAMLTAGVMDFASSGSLTTSWMDANMPSFKKLASHLVVNMNVCDYVTDGTKVQVKIQVNDESSAWLGPYDIKTAGKTWINLNFAFEKVRFQLLLTRGSTITKTPILDSMVLKYQKIPLSYHTWQLSIPLGFHGVWAPKTESLEVALPHQGGGLGPQTTAVLANPRDAATIKADLEALLFSQQMITLTHQGTEYRCRVSSVQGWDMPGLDRRGMRTVTLVEVPLPTVESPTMPMAELGT